jgi:hypothetical protein
MKISLWRNLADFKYDVADWLFPKQMDKAYEQGIRVGAEYAARLMSFNVLEAGEKTELTKAQAAGFEIARKAIRDSKKVIHAKTGAML